MKLCRSFFLFVAVVLLVSTAVTVYAAPSNGSVYAVQVGAFASFERAKVKARTLRAEGYSRTAIVRLFDDAGRLWHVVQLRVMAQREEARAFARKYAQDSKGDVFVRQIDAQLFQERVLRGEAEENPPPLIPPPSEASTLVKDGKLKNQIEQQNRDAAVAPDVAPDVLADEENQDIAPKAGEAFARLFSTESSGFAVESSNEPLQEPLTPFTADDKQARLIVARALFREGRYPEAQQHYRELRKDYPNDEVVWEHYTDTLIASENYAAAEVALKQWREDMPESVSVLRQTGRLYTNLGIETGQYDRAYRWFAALLQKTPQDTGARADYAFALRDGGYWAEALQQFSQVADEAPENEEVHTVITEILRERRPQVTFSNRYEERQGGVELSSWSLEGEMQLSETVRAFAMYDYGTIDRPAGLGTLSVNEEFHHRRVRASFEPVPRFIVYGGIGQYEGAASGFSAEGGLEARVGREGTLRLDGQYSYPWVDTPDALLVDGTQDDLALSYETPLNDFWSMSALVGLRRYNVRGTYGYATQNRLEAALTRRLMTTPDWTVSYTFSRTRTSFDSDDTGNRPVDLLLHEDVHGIRTDFLHWFNEHFAIRAGGSASLDTFKNSPLWGASGGVILRASEHVQFELGVEYNSDSGEAGGGESKALLSSVRILF